MMHPTGTSAEAFAQLAAFLEGGRFTALAAHLEDALNDVGSTAVAREADEVGLNDALLSAALLVRGDIGRLNDVIHAAAICLALPAILEPGELLTNRPSLAAGNDPSRMFDMETDRRIAEFKLSIWTGRDAGRKRGLFHDLVHLAADDSGRRAELYALGPRPIRFLQGSRSKAAWALNRGAESTRVLFEERFGSVDMAIAEFTRGPAAHVQLMDLAEYLPQLSDVLNP